MWWMESGCFSDNFTVSRKAKSSTSSSRVFGLFYYSKRSRGIEVSRVAVNLIRYFAHASSIIHRRPLTLVRWCRGNILVVCTWAPKNDKLHFTWFTPPRILRQLYPFVIIGMVNHLPPRRVHSLRNRGGGARRQRRIRRRRAMAHIFNVWAFSSCLHVPKKRINGVSERR